MTVTPALVWSPTHDYIARKIHQHKSLRILIAPFIKLDGLKRLVEICQDISDLNVIVRWRPQDILAGVSDLSIYPFLKDNHVCLYTHPDIHLKLFIFNESLAFHTSGNITTKGLGTSPNHNIEVGCEVGLTSADWIQLFGILNASNRVDDDIYQRATDYLRANKATAPPLPPLDLRPKSDKRFSRLSLPSSASPEALYAFYHDVDNVTSTDDLAAFTHDLALYHIPQGLSREQFFIALRERFTNHAFIAAIIAFIKSQQSARFGLVNEWLTANCSDKPTPYRWEMKAATRRLYDWLAYFFSEVSWSVPGAHSMVIYWKRDCQEDQRSR